jgi:pentatricopeptide repeat protein
VSWNALIAAYAQHGQGEEALNCLAGMQMEGLHPNTVTFRCILNACSRSGLVTEGEIYFVSMMQQYGIVQDVDHHACMLDLFGRAGNFDRVMTMIRRIPYGDCLLFWDAILGACQKWINVELGRVAFEQAIELDRRNAPSYILMKNIYSAANLHQDVQEVKRP